MVWKPHKNSIMNPQKNNVSVHHGRVQVMIAEMGPVEIRELAWPDALQLYRRMMEQSKVFLDEEGRLQLSAQKLLDAISENIELGTWLVLKATGKDEAWLNERRMSEVLDLAVEAAVLNAGILMERLKNGRSRLQALGGGQAGAPAGAPAEASTKSSPTSPSS